MSKNLNREERAVDVDSNFRGFALIVCATIVEKNKVLLVKHAAADKPDYGQWLLPAGGVKLGESLEEALKREMTEELGLGIRVIRKLVELDDPYTKDRLVNFLCKPLESGIRMSSELSEVRWFDIEEIQALTNIHKGLRQFLVDGFKNDAFKE